MGTTNGRAYREPWAHSDYLRARADCWRYGTTGAFGRVVTRTTVTGADGYHFYYLTTASNTTFYLVRYNGTTPTTLNTQAQSPLTDGPHTLEIVHGGGHVKCYCDTTLIFDATDDQLAANTYCGIYTGGNSRLDNFYCDDVAPPAAALAVSPDPITFQGADPELTLTGTGTAWDAGTNTPVFTVDKGSITSQEIIDETHATAQYVLPHVTDTATFTDPSTSATAVVDLDSTLEVAAGGDNSEVLAILGTPIGPETVLDDLRSIMVGVAITNLPNKIRDLIDAIKNVLDDEDILTSILGFLGISTTNTSAPENITQTAVATLAAVAWVSRNVDLLTDDVAAISGEEELSLRGVINAIAGVPNYTTKEVIEAIGALPPLDVAEITTYLDWITTDQTYNLSTLTTGHSTIIANVQALYTSVTASLSNLTNAGTISLGNVLSAISALDAVVDAVSTDLNNGNAYLTSSATINLQTLKTLLEGIHDDLATDWLDLANHLTDMALQINETREALAADHDLIQIDTNDIRNDLHDVLTKVNSLENTDLTEVNASLARIEAALAALAQPAPVWPGIGLVTLGTEELLSSDQRVIGPMDGVIVQLDSVPQKLSNFPMGDNTYSYRLGFITFEADAGWLEPWQYLGFDSALYCPRQMHQAAACRIRYLGNASGTVQPWTTVEPPA